MENNIEIDQEKNTASTDYTITEILESFKLLDGVYKREQIDAAIGLRDEITPHLLSILENALAFPEKYFGNLRLYHHMYAIMLLGHLKEVKAHKTVVALFSLPDDLTAKMFGDIRASYLPAILLNTCGGSIDLIKAMILNRDVNVYCRISACNALAYAYVEGYVSRESVLEFFGTLFTGEEADRMSDFWGLLAATIYDLYPEEMMDVIKQGYDDKLIFPGMIDYSEFETALAIGKDKCLERFKHNMKRDGLDDIHAVMSNWSCFKKESKIFQPSPDKTNDFAPVFDIPASAKPRKSYKNNNKQDKKKKKKKRKQVNTSKKKNRR